MWIPVPSTPATTGQALPPATQLRMAPKLDAPAAATMASAIKTTLWVAGQTVSVSGCCDAICDEVMLQQGLVWYPCWSSHSTVHFANADAGVSFLRVSPDQVVAGSSVRLVFTAKFADGTAGASVQLYQGLLPGNLTTLIFPLMDDGMFSHRDDVAGDLVYSNTLTIQYNSEGDVNFAAVSSQLSSDYRLIAKLTVLPAPNQTHEAAGLAFAQTLQNQLENQLLTGHGMPQALNNVRDAVLSQLGIAPSDIIVSGRSVRWRTLEGFRFMVQVFVDGERSGGRGRDLLAKDATLGRPYHARAATQQHPFLRAAAMTPGKAGWCESSYCNCTGYRNLYCKSWTTRAFHNARCMTTDTDVVWICHIPQYAC
jgi:hypothetical protein